MNDPRKFARDELLELLVRWEDGALNETENRRLEELLATDEGLHELALFASRSVALADAAERSIRAEQAGHEVHQRPTRRLAIGAGLAVAVSGLVAFWGRRSVAARVTLSDPAGASRLIREGNSRPGIDQEDLRVGDRIEIGDFGHDVSLSDRGGTAVNLGENSLVGITSLSPVRLDLLRGNLHALCSRPGAPLQISTAEAVTSGADAEFSLNRHNARTRVAVNAGDVTLRSAISGKELQLRPATLAEAGLAGKVRSAPRPLLPGRAVLKPSTIAWQHGHPASEDGVSYLRAERVPRKDKPRRFYYSVRTDDFFVEGLARIAGASRIEVRFRQAKPSFFHLIFQARPVRDEIPYGPGQLFEMQSGRWWSRARPDTWRTISFRIRDVRRMGTRVRPGNGFASMANDPPAEGSALTWLLIQSHEDVGLEIESVRVLPPDD